MCYNKRRSCIYNLSMKKIIKIAVLFILLGILTFSPIEAQDKIKMVARINQEFSLEEIPSEIDFKTMKEVTISDDIVIPKNSILVIETMQAQKEKRWHRSGFIIGKLKNYMPSYYEEKIDLTDKNIYIVVKKYEKIKGKDAAIIGTEIVLSQAASIFVPGIDILYFFSKGVIKGEKNTTRIKAGIHSAYENSIFWFWLKGKPIDLEEDETVSLKEIKEKRAMKINTKIEKRKAKNKQ